MTIYRNFAHDNPFHLTSLKGLLERAKSNETTTPKRNWDSSHYPQKCLHYTIRIQETAKIEGITILFWCWVLYGFKSLNQYNILKKKNEYVNDENESLCMLFSFKRRTKVCVLSGKTFIGWGEFKNGEVTNTASAFPAENSLEEYPLKTSCKEFLAENFSADKDKYEWQKFIWNKKNKNELCLWLNYYTTLNINFVLKNRRNQT